MALDYVPIQKHERIDHISVLVRSIPTNLRQYTYEYLEKLAKPTKTDWQLRMAFWNELRLASEFNRPIEISHLYRGICTYQHWRQRVVPNKKRLAWILYPNFDEFTHRMVSDVVLVKIRAWIDRQEIYDLCYKDSGKDCDRLREILSLLLLFPVKS